MTTGPVGAPVGDPPAGSMLMAMPHARSMREASSGDSFITWSTSVVYSHTKPFGSMKFAFVVFRQYP